MESITAISTPAGVGGIAVIRLSGKDALEIADRVWKGKRLSEVESHTAHLGEILDAEGEMIDSAVATVFREGRSFTGENTVEFSVHGSKWIQREVIARLIQAGARAADRGEFTQRAFLNGRLDLAQAEAVADLIASESKAAHRIAASQIKGQFSRRLNAIRDDMIKLASLLELELDFSEEEVEFADRKQLLDLTESTLSQIRRLSSTFRTGKALKEGVPTVIAGIPNAGKSTLLNHLIGDEKAIVSDIPGTTRDTIEDTAEINGVLYRFIDTAGLRDSDDTIERIGIERAHAQLSKARIILWLIDPTSP
ncbi:MAG: tRNA uridine-5-carboxymethylaminomethyl(34) synthesis GTPase MnmE, partial [Muribaculaceae bacterium]|nr:tRNA uridine-5-carboxymethylaminomethyl(34) synthesis GTPase MnmE [Muribaculaceae bacterium]